MKKEFYDKPIYTITNYFTNFVASSIYLAVCNILLILFFVLTAMSPDKFNIFFLFIALIPLGPSLGTLYSTISKLLREKDIYFSSYFWNTYKKNFVSFLKLWMVELIILTILFIDFQYFYLHMPQTGIYFVFVVLMAITLLIGLYAFPIASRFEVKLKDVFILSIYYAIKKFPITILKAIVIFLIYYLSKNLSILFLIFTPSIICSIFYFYDRNLLKELEDKFVACDNNI